MIIQNQITCIDLTSMTPTHCTPFKHKRRRRTCQIAAGAHGVEDRAKHVFDGVDVFLQDDKIIATCNTFSETVLREEVFYHNESC